MTNETQPTTEIIFHGHDVDGILFVTRDDGSIQGAGWQGRSFMFRPGQEDLLRSTIQLLSDNRSRSENNYGVSVRRGNEELNLEVKDMQGWIEVVDKRQDVGFAIATADKEAIIHILGELKVLLAGTNPHANHFCEQYGKIDDD